MLSIYIHVPFCDHKCEYCSFQVLPTDLMNVEVSPIIQNYTDKMIEEIKYWADKVGKQEIKTIYFGGGTPSKLGKENIIKIVDTIAEYFDIENIGELSIELNPNPHDEILNLIKDLNKSFKKIPRVRFSIGIQSFDGTVLKESGRQYTFPGVVDFLRALRPLKRENNIFNLDFISFGKFNISKKGNRSLWDKDKMEFFDNLAHSGFIDSYSLYTLELFSGSTWYEQQKRANPEIDAENKPKAGLGLKKYGSDDDVYEEFSILKDIISSNGYNRYELSNFAITGRSSIHNRAYWNMENYIGIGTSASSFIDLEKLDENQEVKKFFNTKDDTKSIRRTNTIILKDYMDGNYIDTDTVDLMNNDDYLIEKFFLRLRTDEGIKDISEFDNVLVKNWKNKVENMIEQGFVEFDETRLRLTDEGMDIYNTIITELLEEI